MNGKTIRTGAMMVAATLCVLADGGSAQTGQAGDGVRRLSAAEASASVAVKANGLAATSLPVAPGVIALVVGRDRSGEVESHDNFADILVGQAGEGTLLVGGHASGQKRTAPGEWRGGTIVGGRELRLAPGDVIWVPAGVPHQLKLQKGTTFQYLAFKFPRTAKP